MQSSLNNSSASLRKNGWEMKVRGAEGKESGVRERGRFLLPVSEIKDPLWEIPMTIVGVRFQKEEFSRISFTEVSSSTA